MSNLTIENLGRIVQTGDAESFLGGSSVAAEARALRESAASPVSAPGSAGESTNTFSQVLRDSMDKVNTYQSQADTAIKELVAGRNKNIHETLLTIERADSSLKLMMQVRNKILDAYREIMRMQV
jgi:flagellar hook-basal body complex protein FliE